MEEINIFVGLKQKDMQTDVSPDQALNVMQRELNKIGVSGFNTDQIKGCWGNSQEPTLKISFVNTFKVNYEQINTALGNAKIELNQESILYTKQKVKYAFI